MVLERFYTPGLAQVAYLVGDEQTKTAALIDPRRDVDAYVEWAEAQGYRITAILETHVHADFVSGGLELQAVTGAPIYASRLGEQNFVYEPLDDGDEVAIGSLRLRALWTPGHTPEHIAFLLFAGDAPEPVALFSGDALFVGDVGRPDLLGDKETDRLINMLYETITERLAPLPDTLKVYPGHTGGSSCGKMIGDAPDTTIGAEKIGNYAFQEKEREGFIAAVMEGMPKPPAYYPFLKKVNKEGAEPIEALAEPAPMTSESFKKAMDDGALVLDVRGPDAFGDGHIPNALSVGFGSNFHAWMGWVAPFDRDIVMVTGDNGVVDEVVTALHQIGLDRVIGYLDDGMAAWTGDVDTLEQMTTDELAAKLQDGIEIVDVRSDAEWKDGHIAGAEHVFLGDIAQGAVLPERLPRDHPIAVICGTGYRSSVAASILQSEGYSNLISIEGGMTDWNDARLPVETR